jgi:hypothetical protein
MGNVCEGESDRYGADSRDSKLYKVPIKRRNEQVNNTTTGIK